MEVIDEQEIEKRIKENNCYLLGQVPINKQEYSYIMEYLENLIKFPNEVLHEERADLVLALALVHVAINDYQDGKYWEILKNKLKITELTNQKQLIIGKMFLATIRKYKLFELKQEEHTVQRYVENIKAHAFVTNNYMEDYYEFLEDYYENNLARDISNDVEDYLQDLSNYMQTTLSSQKDVITEETSNRKNPKTYKLLKSTREVIAGCDGKLLYKLFYPSLKLIDDRFYDGIIPNSSENRFIEIFMNWAIKQESIEEKTGNIRRTNHDRKAYSRRPYIKMDYKNHQFKLVIPQRSYRKSDCNGNAVATLDIDGIHKNINLEMFTHLGSYFSEEREILLTDPFSEIKIEIETLNTETFSIHNKGYAFFNERHINTNRLEIGYTYLLVEESKTVSFANQSDCIDCYQYEDWIYYAINVTQDTVCYIDNKPISIIGEFSEEPVFELGINNFAMFNSKNEKVTISRKHPIISFVLNSSQINGVAITVNNRELKQHSNPKLQSNTLETYCFNNRNFSVTNRKEIHIYDYPTNREKKIVSVDLNDLLLIETGKYRVELNIPGEKNKVICEYVLLKKFNFIFDKLRYVGESEAFFTIITDGLNVDITSENVELLNDVRIMQNSEMLEKSQYGHAFQEIENEYPSQDKKYKIHLNTSTREVVCSVYIDGEKYFIRQSIKLRLYGNSTNNLIYGKKDYIWYKELKEWIYIKMPGAKELGIYYNKDIEKTVYGEEIEPELYRVNISKFLEKINNSTSRYHYLNIKYVDNKDRWMPLYTVLRIADIEPYFELEYIDGVIGYKVNRIKGAKRSKVYISVREQLTYKTVIEHKIVEEGVNLLPELEKEKMYIITPTVEEVDQFGLNKIVTNMQTKKVGFMSYKNNKQKSAKLIGARLQIEAFSYNNKKLPLNPKYRYYIEIKNIQNNEYNGIIIEAEVTKKLDKLKIIDRRTLGRVKVIIKKENTIKTLFKLKNYSQIEKTWESLFYKKDEQRLLEYDNNELDSLLVSEVLELKFDNTKFLAKIKK